MSFWGRKPNYCHTTLTIEFDSLETAAEFYDLLYRCKDNLSVGFDEFKNYWSSKKVVTELGLDEDLAREKGGCFSDIDKIDNVITMDRRTEKIPQFKLITAILDKIAKGKYKLLYIADNDYKTLFVTNDRDFVGNYAYHDKTHSYQYVEANVWNDPELYKQYLKDDERKRDFLFNIKKHNFS